MCEVAVLIADMVRAGVDADLIGRTAAALADREPVLVHAGDEAGCAAGGDDGRSAAAIRQARYRARRAAHSEPGRNTGITRYVTRYGAGEQGRTDKASDFVEETTKHTGCAGADERNTALQSVTRDVTRYGGPQKENSPHTPQEKNSPLKEKAPKGAQKKVPPEAIGAGLFSADQAADGSPTGSAAAAAETDRKRRSRRHGGDIAGLTDEFDTDVWPIYPQKVAKKTALKAWCSARHRADFDTIMDGLRRYIAKRDDRPWCNLSTWLNQDRWTDRPAITAARAPPGQGGRETIRQRQERAARNLRGEHEPDYRTTIDIACTDYRAGG